MAIIDMQAMRYINLLDKFSRVKTRRCFVHNNTLFFAVNRQLVSQAIGVAAANIKKIEENVGRKVRIVREPEGIQDAKRFIEDIISPIKLKSIEIREGTLFISVMSMQNKAALIGRNKRRYFELKKVVEDFFNLDLKIV